MKSRILAAARDHRRKVNVVGSTCAAPSNATGFNAAVLPQGTVGYLSLWPDGEQQPVVSTLNAQDGFAASNVAIVLSNRVRAALEVRSKNSRFVFPADRSGSGHIETVQKQFASAKKLAGLPDPIVLYCARHRFSTDAMEGTGNLMAVMNVMAPARRR